MKRHAGYVLKAVVLLLVQANLVDMISLRGITPDLLLIFIVTLAVREGQVYVLPWGFFLGLVLDLSTGTVIGLSAFSKTVAAFTAGYFYSENKIVMTLATYRFLLLVFFTASVHNAVYFVIFTMGGDIGFFGAVFGVGLASALFTTTVAILPMLVTARGRISP
ncbi:MAG TPA: rod shape-determining protein MreD [Bacteroidota bacterium]|nr:rod shape-determining protein MreD [Bacteroidota bacterium]